MKAAIKKKVFKRRVMSMKNLTMIKGFNGKATDSERPSSNESKYGASTNSKVTSVSRFEKRRRLAKQKTSFVMSQTPTFKMQKKFTFDKNGSVNDSPEEKSPLIHYNSMINIKLGNFSKQGGSSGP